MSPKTPFLPGISHQLYGRQKRSQLDEIRRQTARIRDASLSRLAEIFGRWLPENSFETNAKGVNSRDSVYTMGLTFWAFLSQVLNPGSPCREIVRKVQVWHARHGAKKIPASTTGAYCVARQRLPVEKLAELNQELAGLVEAPIAENGVWKGHRVRVIDGTGASMPDTPENQEAFPQPSNQKPGCGFPVVKLLGVFCLNTGALLRAIYTTLSEHECRAFGRLFDWFSPGDIVLGDRAFCGYGQMAMLWERGVDAVMRLHQRRKVDWRKGNKIGERDRLVVWKKPARQGDVFDQRTWEELPQELLVRQLEVTVWAPGFRTTKLIIVTTLLDPERYPAAAVADLYFRRWQVEVFYRDIKQTMGMDILRCKTPEMIQKELHMHAIAYNLIRALMKDIAAHCQVDLSRVSFKGTLDALRQWNALFESEKRNRRAPRKWVTMFYECVAADPLIIRPNRSEPRALKRRPKNFRLMTKPRDEMVVERCRKLSQKSSKPHLN